MQVARSKLLNQFKEVRQLTLLRHDALPLEKGRMRKYLDPLIKQLEFEQVAFSFIEHGENVNIVNKSDQRWSSWGKADGLITVEKGMALFMSHADCQVATFYDPVEQVLANVHCGWRSQVKNIYNNTVKKMTKSFGSDPLNIRVSISASLGPQHSEFVNYKEEFPKEYHLFQEKPFYFNLWELAKWQLLEAGLKEEHIEIAEECTYSDPEHYHSYRRDKTPYRMVTLASLL